MQLIDDSVLVEMEEDRMTQGGIAIPRNALSTRSTRGKVVAIGPGELVSLDGKWTRRPVDIAKGSWVLLSPNAGRELRVEDKKHLLCKFKDVWMVLSETDEID